MDDNWDEFGDLYGDLDRHPDADPTKKDDSISKDVEVDSAVENGGMLSLEDNTNYSDSDDDDDDFQIVLNEDENPRFQPTKGGGVNGSDAEDEGDQLRPSTMEDELMEGGEARGVEASTEQKWNVGSNSAGFSSGVRMLVSGKGDRPCFQSTSCCNAEISHHGGGFFLPRNRTIFDISIEAFKQKPWRLQGVDITDYFNFGLDEESWKSYSGFLDNLRQQARISNRLPLCTSSRFNQREKYPSAQEGVEKRGKTFDMPKGRAIQVEDGLGERLPSMDLRRPRLFDSDVVIEIPMGAAAKDASESSLEHAEEHIDTPLSVSGNNTKERGTTNSVGEAGIKDGELRVRTLQKYNCNEDEKEDRARSDVHYPYSQRSSSHGPQNYSEESNDTLSTLKRIMPIQGASIPGLLDSAESEYYLSDDSLSDTIKSEENYGKDDTYEQNCSSGESKHFCRTRYRSSAKDDELASNQHHKSNCSNVDLKYSRFKERKRKSSNNVDVTEALYPCYESKLSVNYKRRLYTRESGYSKQGECSIAERCHNEHTARNSVHKYSELRVSENRHISEGRDFFLEKDRDERQFRMDSVYVDDRYRERNIQDIHDRGRAFFDFVDFDHKYDRYDYRSDTKTRSPERRYKYNDMTNDELDMSDKCRYNVAKTQINLDRGLGSQRYEETSPMEERNLYDVFSPRGRLHFASRRKAREFRRKLNVREVHLRSERYANVEPGIKNVARFSSKATLESELDRYVSEEDIFYDNYISKSQMKRCNELPELDLYTDDGARFSYCEEGRLPSLEKSLRKNVIYDKIKVNQPSVFGKAFFGPSQLNNARKGTVRGSIDFKARDHDMGKHKVSAVGCRETVNKDLNGLNGKLSRNSSGVAVERKKQIDNKQKSSEDSNKPYKQSETPHKPNFQGSNNHHFGLKGRIIGKSKPSNSKSTKIEVEDKKEEDGEGGGGQNQQLGRKVNVILESKPFNSIKHIKTAGEDTEIEEGELVEESDKQKVASGKKMEKLQAADSSSNNKVVGIYNNHHILETLAKMEKRKERFKDPIGIKQGTEKITDPQRTTSIVMNEVTQQRPARKRRWGGN